MKKCRDCNNKREAGKSMCRVCLDRTSARMRQLRKDAIASGLCGKCRVNNLVEGETRCQDCIDRDRSADIKRRQEYLKAGRCEKCGKDKSDISIWDHNWCAYCQLKYRFAHKGTRAEATSIINNLLEKQNYKCALTGRDLHNNKFHIDHIVPKSKGGINIPNNWQLIVEEANVFKTDLSMEEIIKLAKDIAMNFKD